MDKLFKNRLDLALREAAAKGLKPWDLDSPMDRLLRKLGIHVRPPHYRPFWRNVLAYGFMFGPVWGAWMWVMLWSGQNMKFDAVLATSAFAGMLFGFLNACFVKWQARRAKLSSWENLENAPIG